MAAEVLILRKNERNDGSVDYEVVVFYPVNPQITVGSGPPMVVKPTPSDQLPGICDEYNLVPRAYKTQLDNGDAVFEHVTIRKPKALTNPEMIQRIKGRYPARAAALIAELRERYNLVGTWVDI